MPSISSTPLSTSPVFTPKRINNEAITIYTGLADPIPNADSTVFLQKVGTVSQFNQGITTEEVVFGMGNKFAEGKIEVTLGERDRLKLGKQVTLKAFQAKGDVFELTLENPVSGTGEKKQTLVVTVHKNELKSLKFASEEASNDSLISTIKDKIKQTNAPAVETSGRSSRKESTIAKEIKETGKTTFGKDNVRLTTVTIGNDINEVAIYPTDTTYKLELPINASADFSGFGQQEIRLSAGKTPSGTTSITIGENDSLRLEEGITLSAAADDSSGKNKVMTFTKTLKNGQVKTFIITVEKDLLSSVTINANDDTAKPAKLKEWLIKQGK